MTYIFVCSYTTFSCALGLCKTQSYTVLMGKLYINFLLCIIKEKKNAQNSPVIISSGKSARNQKQFIVKDCLIKVFFTKCYINLSTT